MPAILRTPTILSEIEICYTAALFEGLRLINEKEAELKIEAEMDASALQQFVRRKGDYLVGLTMYSGIVA